MIEFECDNCGQKIKAPVNLAGQESLCPGCKHTVIIPEATEPETFKRKSDVVETRLRAKYSDDDFKLLNIQQEYHLKSLEVEEEGVTESGEEENREQTKESEASEVALERRLPWILDIFLYPLSKAGIKHLSLFVLVPFLLAFLLNQMPYLLDALFGLISLVINIFIVLYLFWYLAECMRDSADGWVRAPGGLGAIPDIEDMLRIVFDSVGCFCFFLIPLGIYYTREGRADLIFWLLLSVAAFFYPIALLSMILTYSVSEINLSLFIKPVQKTFFPYLGLVLLFVFLGGLSLAYFFRESYFSVKALAFRFCLIYAAFIVAHLTGRFYWRYKERLGWSF